MIAGVDPKQCALAYYVVQYVWCNLRGAILWCGLCGVHSNLCNLCSTTYVVKYVWWNLYGANVLIDVV